MAGEDSEEEDDLIAPEAWKEEDENMMPGVQLRQSLFPWIPPYLYFPTVEGFGDVRVHSKAKLEIVWEVALARLTAAVHPLGPRECAGLDVR
jgi:hypothetical protein